MVAFDLFARTAIVILVNSLWQGALVAGVTWLALRSFPRVNASTRYAAWVLALLAIPLIALATSIPHVEFAAPATRVQGPIHSVVTKHQMPAKRTALPQTDRQPQPRLTIPRRPTVHLNAPFLAAAALFGLWALAAFAMLARLAVALARLEKLKHDALPLSIDVRDRLEQYRRASEDARDVRICTTNGIDVPVAVGLFDAMVLLPQHLIDSLDSNELDQITLHELAHLLRHDDWTNGLQRLLSSLFFFNPAVWFIGRQLDIEREVACDDYVLELTGAVRSYAFCLTKMAEMTAWPHQPLAAPGVFITRKNISIRIERLLRTGRAISSAISPGIASGVTGGLIVACALAWVATPRVAFALSAPSPIPARTAAVLATPKPPAGTAKPVRIAQVTPAPPTPPPTRTHEIHVAVPTRVAVPIHVPAVAITSQPAIVRVSQAGKADARRSANCMACNFENANLAGRDFSHANLAAANFARANLRGARFNSANLEGANFSGADLRDVSFAHSNLMGCNLAGAKLAGARFDESALTGCNLVPEALSPTQAKVFLANCEGCTLAGARFDGQDLHGMHLMGTDLRYASLRNVDLSGAHVTGVNFEHADLRGTIVNGTVFMGCDFAHADLRNVDLNKARVVGSSLSGAIMNS